MLVQHETAKENFHEAGASCAIRQVSSPFQPRRDGSGARGEMGLSSIGFVLQIVGLLTFIMAPEAMAKSDEQHFQNRYRSVPLSALVRGEGAASRNPDGISCENRRCDGDISRGTVVRLQDESNEWLISYDRRKAGGESRTRVVNLKRPRNFLTISSSPRLFPLRVIVKGEGTITSSPDRLECSNNVCFGKFPENSLVTLSAIPGEEQSFTGWRGRCSGEETCTVKMKRPRTVVANFASPLKHEAWSVKGNF